MTLMCFKFLLFDKIILSQSYYYMKSRKLLSRIQSSDAFQEQQISGACLRSHSQIGSHNSDSNTNKHQQIKRYLKFGNKKKDTTYFSNKIKDSSTSICSKKKFQTLSSFQKMKKSINSSRIDEVKKALNFEQTQTNGINDMRNFLQITKKMHKGSQKLIKYQDSRSTCLKEQDKNIHRLNTITNQNIDLNSQRNIQNQESKSKSSKGFNNLKNLNKKDYLRIFDRKSVTKGLPSVSDHHIELHSEFPQKTETTIKEKKIIHPFSKTNTIFIRSKQFSQMPYINHKIEDNHFEEPKQINKIQEESENDVSIRLSSEKEKKPQEFPSLNESQIQQLENDSSFLGNSDKKIIENLLTIEQSKEKSKRKRKHWKRLPDDFLK